MSAMPNTNPLTAWKALKEGNERFVAGTPEHPSQGIEDRARLTEAQKPTAVLFGCGDSRVAAEIIFDQGLGDMFVVRTAGHVIDSAVLGSIEYAVLVLNVPLIVVLGHDSCGAVTAAIKGGDNGYNLNHLLSHIAPAIAASPEGADVNAVVRTNASMNAQELQNRSAIIRGAVESGKLKIASAYYHLESGKVEFLD